MSSYNVMIVLKYHHFQLVGPAIKDLETLFWFIVAHNVLLIKLEIFQRWFFIRTRRIGIDFYFFPMDISSLPVFFHSLNTNK